MVLIETGHQGGRESVGVRATTKRIRTMRRMLGVALLAGSVALFSAAPVRAQGCVGCGSGGAGVGAPGSGGPGYNPGGYPMTSGNTGGRPGLNVPPFGFPFGFAFRLYPGLHQHGPLVNYGPYSGYYPFEPYGPWTSDLRYNGPVGPMNGGGRGSAATGWAPAVSNLFHHGYFRHGGSCSTCAGGSHGQYALATLRNVAARLNPFHRFGCTSCGN